VAGRPQHGLRRDATATLGLHGTGFIRVSWAARQECRGSLFWLQAVAKLGSFAWDFRVFAAGGFRGTIRFWLWASEIHDLVAAVPLVLFHGVHHGVIVALIGVEDFSPLFTDFGDEWIVIHGFVRLFREGREELPGILEAVFWVADEGFVDSGGDFLGQARQAVADGDGVFVEDDVDGGVLGIEPVGELAGEVVEGGGETPDVRDGFDVFAPRRRRCPRPSHCRGSGRCAGAGVWR
jgi:hypothetical protein